MNKIFVFLFLIFGVISHAQIKEKISWTKEVKSLDDNQFEVIFKAHLVEGWHVYSLDNTNKDIIPTNVTFAKSTDFELVGKLNYTGKKKTEFSKAFGTDLTTLGGMVVYTQRIKAKSKSSFVIKASVEYQVCNDQSCLAPEIREYDILINPKISDKNEIKKTDIETDSQKIEDATISTKQIDTKKSIISDSKLKSNQLIIPSINIEKPLSKECNEGVKTSSKSYLKILLLGFLGGLIALLTPCVFPMIPLTVSFFTKGHQKGKGKKNAISYALFILLIFISLSIPFYILQGIQPDIFNQISTNVYVNISFFIIFIVFAFSFFGYFELTLPNSILNKSSNAENAGGFIGIFFMALTLIIVSFSCTGPILGTLLANAIESPQQLTAALAGFGLSWAIIFGGFAFFPKVLSTLPKSGGWLNTIKVLLGFIELGLALKFLSKADLVSKTFLIKRELFVFIWIIISILVVLYLFKIIQFPHDDKKEKMGWGKKIIAVFFVGFTIYLIPGLFPTPTKQTNLAILSGILPPTTVSYFNEGETCPLGLNCYHDFQEALAVAKAENKPILIDFTGYGCENCRKMEEFVWSEPDILAILEKEVVLASLYVDDKTELPEKEQFSIELKDGSSRKIKTIGDKWSVFQRENFNNNSQPFYVLITPDQRIINLPKGDNGYMSKENFKEFLECGIHYYKNSK